MGKRLGSFIRNHRRELNWTTADFAKRIGIAPSYLSSIERGEKEPSIKIIPRLAAILDEDLHNLIFLQNEDQLESALGDLEARKYSDGYRMSDEELREVHLIEIELARHKGRSAIAVDAVLMDFVREELIQNEDVRAILKALDSLDVEDIRVLRTMFETLHPDSFKDLAAMRIRVREKKNP